MTSAHLPVSSVTGDFVDLLRGPISASIDTSGVWARPAPPPPTGPRAASGRASARRPADRSSHMSRRSRRNSQPDAGPDAKLVVTRLLGPLFAEANDVAADELTRRYGSWAELDIEPVHADDFVQLIKNWTGLPMARIANLLGVSRRALYDWYSGKPSLATNAHRASALIDALRPLAMQWDSTRLGAWLSSGDPSPLELAEAGDLDSFARRAGEATADREPVPPTLLDVRLVDPGTEVQALSREEVGAFLARLRVPRTPNKRASWTPRELAYSEPDDE